MLFHQFISAHVAVVCSNPAFTATVIGIVADVRTAVTVIADGSGPLFRSHFAEIPDVVVFDRETVSDVARRMRMIRRWWPTAQIVVLNARDERECARLIDEGADDACRTGCPMLSARLGGVTRRARTINADMRVAIGDVVVDRERRRVWCAGSEVSLSSKEYDVLICLFQHAPRTVGKTTLSDFVWGDAAPQPNTLEVYIGYLRRKLVRSSRVVIETVRRVGYALATISCFVMSVLMAGADLDAPALEDDFVKRSSFGRTATGRNLPQSPLRAS